MLTYPVSNLISQVEGEKILITITPTALFTAGINLTFASGTLTIDWKDGSGTENFVSGVELTHQYVSSGTYIAEISGDLTNITKFIAPSSRITFISGLQTGLLTDFQIYSNLYAGVLNMSLAPISGNFRVYSNIGLTQIIHATSGNAATTTYYAYSCGIIGTHNLTNNPVGGLLYIHSNPLMTGINFATSGNNQLTDVRLNSCGFLGVLDFSNNPLRNRFWVQINAGLTNVIFAASGNGVLTSVIAYSCLLPNLDFSNFSTSDNVSITIRSNSFTATEHDDQLINLDGTGWINGTLNIITGNTARTAASDAAHANLLVNGWSII